MVFRDNQKIQTPLKSEKGFTLIELLIGVMIVAVLAVAGTPHFTRFLQGFRLNGASRVVWGDLQKARHMAIKEARTMRIDFTTTSYEIIRVATAEVVFRRNLSSIYPGVTVNITNNSVSFGSSGTAGGGGKTVEVQNTLGMKSFTILTTGRIGNIS